MSMIFGVVNNSESVLFLLWELLKALFELFLGICAAVVLIKLAFGTLHINITVDNLDDLIKKQVAANVKLGGTYVQKGKDVIKVADAKNPQEKELERFKELLRNRGTLSKEEIDRLTYEDLQTFRRGHDE